MISTKMYLSRWMQGLRNHKRVPLDTAGIILLSSSAMMWDPIAGTAAAGVGCLVLNWLIHDRT
jgi:hypothetical protein